MCEGKKYYRDLPWRNTRDAYAVLVSEFMLQQTQVARVDGKWQNWMCRFPTLEALAAAPVGDVLAEWQGLGYNRRALALHNTARIVAEKGGTVPSDTNSLLKLPGIGPATAAALRAFAFDLPGIYLETNVRAVFIHEFFSHRLSVSDKELIPLVARTCPQADIQKDGSPRIWYFALLDYGAHLKATQENPSRRSRSYTKQSRFEGSHRQKRAALLRVLLSYPKGCSFDVISKEMAQNSSSDKAFKISDEELLALLKELSAEGFCVYFRGRWRIDEV